jgi:hypothetical protein
LKLGQRYHSCSVGRRFSNTDRDRPRLWLRQTDGGLYEIQRRTRELDQRHAAELPADRPPDGRPESGGGGHELQISQADRTYRVLVAAAAASCQFPNSTSAASPQGGDVFVRLPNHLTEKSHPTTARQRRRLNFTLSEAAMFPDRSR